MFQQSSYSEQLTFFQKLRSFDFVLVFSVLLLGLISNISMFSTDGGELLYHTKSHLVRFVVFFVMMLFPGIFSLGILVWYNRVWVSKMGEFIFY